MAEIDNSEQVRFKALAPDARRRGYFPNIRPYLPLIGAIAVLLLAYWIIRQLPSAQDQSASVKMFVRLFDLNGENNVPTWFTSLLWQVGALCCYLLSRADLERTGRVRNGVFWIALGCAALFFSLDEVAEIHEGVGDIIDAYATDLPVYGWVFYGVGLVAVAGLFFGRFILTLPRDTALTIVLAGAVFVTGALGFETLGALVELGTLKQFPAGLNWGRSIAIEEVLEMMGAVLLIVALHTHLRRMTAPS